MIQFLAGKMSDLDYDIEEEMFFENLKSYMRKYRSYKKLDAADDFIKSLAKEKTYGF